MICSLWVHFQPNCARTLFFCEVANPEVWLACNEVVCPVANSNSSLSSSTSARSEIFVTSLPSESLGCATRARVRRSCSWNLDWPRSVCIFSIAWWSALLQVFEFGITGTEHPMIAQIWALSWWSLQYRSRLLDRGVWQLWTLQHGCPIVTPSITTTETLRRPVAINSQISFYNSTYHNTKLQHTIRCEACTFVTIVSYFRLAIKTHAVVPQPDGFLVPVLVKSSMRYREYLFPWREILKKGENHESIPNVVRVQGESKCPTWRRFVISREG